MYQFLAATSVMRRTEPLEDPLHGGVEQQVDAEQIQPEEHRRQDHDDRRGVDLGLRRPRHALHLVAHLGEELDDSAATSASGAVDAAPLSSRRRHFVERRSPRVSILSIRVRVGRPTSALLGSSLAGQEGLEPPTPGFGDRCSTN